jgi:hypothetical protein
MFMWGLRPAGFMDVRLFGCLESYLESIDADIYILYMYIVGKRA